MRSFNRERKVKDCFKAFMQRYSLVPKGGCRSSLDVQVGIWDFGDFFSPMFS